MFNVGGAELLVILLVALLVLGPDKLPDAAKKVGDIVGELRRMSSGFKSEMMQALDETTEASGRKKGAEVTKAPVSKSRPTTESESAEREPDGG